MKVRVFFIFPHQFELRVYSKFHMQWRWEFFFLFLHQFELRVYSKFHRQWRWEFFFISTPIWSERLFQVPQAMRVRVFLFPHQFELRVYSKFHRQWRWEFFYFHTNLSWEFIPSSTENEGESFFYISTPIWAESLFQVPHAMKVRVFFFISTPIWAESLFQVPQTMKVRVFFYFHTNLSWEVIPSSTGNEGESFFISWADNFIYECIVRMTYIFSVFSS